MSGSSTTTTPVSQIGKTLLGQLRELEAITAITPLYNTATTINAKHGVFPTLLPTALPNINYFGIGIGGSQNIGSGNLSQPIPVLQTNMDLYSPIPFRCVPVTADLTGAEQALYRMRVLQTINGSQFYCYYLKVVTVNQETVQINQTNPTTGIQTPYTINLANLSPTPPAVGTPQPSTGTEVHVSVTLTLPLTGAEVTEVINIFFSGNLLNARISELGLYSGQDQTVIGSLTTGGTISYTEAILAQLNLQYNWNGDDFSSVLVSNNYQIALSNGQNLLM